MVRSLRVLVLAAQLPLPLDSGARIRTFHLLKELARKHRITLVCFLRDESDRAGISQMQQEGIQIVAIDQPRTALRKLRDCVRSLLYRLPYTVLANTEPRYAQRVEQLLLAQSFDCVLLEEVYCAANLKLQSVECPVLLDTFNNESLILERLAQSASSFVSGLAHRFQARAMGQFEQTLGATVDHVVCVSQEDCSYYERFSKQCSLVPNGIASVAHPATTARKKQILFIGTLEYPPNAEAVAYFLDAVWPEVQKHCQEVEFSVVARRVDARLRNRANKKVVFYSDVDDSAPFFLESSLLVVPLRSGSGTRIKVLEAFAHRLPVVSTSIGVEGLGVDAAHCTICDEPEAMAEAIVQLLRYPERSAKQIENAQQLVEQKYLWSHSAAKLESELIRLCQ